MIDQFLSGAVTMGFAVAGLLFLSYWRRTGETLFLTFAGSFSLLAVNYAWLALTNIPIEERSSLYILRLIAFSLIIVAIVQANRRR